MGDHGARLMGLALLVLASCIAALPNATPERERQVATGVPNAQTPTTELKPEPEDELEVPGVDEVDCRFEPEECPGDYGAFCADGTECIDGLLCCDDERNCGGGMCTTECRDDQDCPVDMGCQHGVCFYACEEDVDCALGQTCEHGQTVCEWP
ncbi:MAG: hypothetical protein KTR31_28020 [Myxococcales bacterium]|nr:hypothetical protein [Myxococcales bacterium]